MKKIFILFFLILLNLSQTNLFAEDVNNVHVFDSDNHKFFGLKTSNDEVVANAIYRKMIRLGDNAWIFQKKNNKFGLMDSKGNILVEPKYTHAERLFDKWVKLGNDRDYGIYDECGNIIVPPKFKSIEPLFGHKFLTYRNYKYGIYSDTGEELLPNKYDFIYMPDLKTIRIKSGMDWYEIEQIKHDEGTVISEDMLSKNEEEEGDFKITKLVINSGYELGYGLVTATDYALKVVSSISEAYEGAIDELMLSKGAETVSIFVKFGWLPKFPVVYAKKYYESLTTPDNSPLSEIRNGIREQMR